jgi:hypothetical protein
VPTKRARRPQAGRPTFEPTQAQRTSVGLKAAAGYRRAKIAELLGIDPKTLRKHFRHELKNGKADWDAKILERLYYDGATEKNPLSRIYIQNRNDQGRGGQLFEQAPIAKNIIYPNGGPGHGNPTGSSYAIDVSDGPGTERLEFHGQPGHVIEQQPAQKPKAYAELSPMEKLARHAECRSHASARRRNAQCAHACAPVGFDLPWMPPTLGERCISAKSCGSARARTGNRSAKRCAASAHWPHPVVHMRWLAVLLFVSLALDAALFGVILCALDMP